MKGRAITYSQQELDWVSENRTMLSEDLHRAFCEKFNREDVNKKNLLALKKRNGWKTGRDGRFKLGNVPLNAGPKGPNKTSFKKGHVPRGTLPIGSERPAKDGHIAVKVADPNVWKLKRHLVWEKENGEIPEGCCVISKDGDTNNLDPSNLQLVSRHENLQINMIIAECSSKEVRPTVVALGRLIARTVESSRR